MSCLSPPPLDRHKAPNPLEVLVLILFVILLIIGAWGPARAGAEKPPDVLGYWGLCRDSGPCFSATLRFNQGRSQWRDCFMSMSSVQNALGVLFTTGFLIRTECLSEHAPDPNWWQAMRNIDPPA